METAREVSSTHKEAALRRLADRARELIARDTQLAAMMPDAGVAESFLDDSVPLERALDRIFETYSERPALGMRDYAIARDPASGNTVRQYLPAFKTISYGEFREDIHAIASAWTHESALSVKRDDFVCIVGFASVEYGAIDTACHYVQAVPVPMQSTTSGADIDEIFGNINPAAVAATIDDLVTVTQHVVRHGEIPSLIVFDYDARDDTELNRFQEAQAMLEAGAAGTRLITYRQLVDTGKAHAWSFLDRHPEPPTERTALIIHSSGATGKPKGAMLSEAGVKAAWNPTPDKLPSVTVLFAPFNHGLGRMAMITSLRKGSTAYFTLKQDMSTLFEDIRIARPTFLSFFPRVFELIYQHYQNEVASRVADGQAEAVAQDQVKAQMRQSFLGDRLLSGLIGSAPTPQVVKEFIVDCFDIFLEEGYANTETGSGSLMRDNVIQRPNVIDYKLADVPELGYYTTDKPHPRGELCFKSRYQIKGYYADPAATAELFDDEGYVRSGDIVEERAPDHLVLIDRRKDVLKLSQGEYVAVGPLGTVFESNSAAIKQVYIYGNSSRSYLLAVVVPDEAAVRTALGDNYDAESLKNLLRKELQYAAQNADLKSFEVPRDFIVETEAFSQENGLLSSVRKRLRPALNRKYGDRLEAIYEEHASASQREYESLKDPGSTLGVTEKLVKLTEITLGRKAIDASNHGTFNELGGDSLGAVTFSLSIEDVFGVSVGADSILSPTGNLKKWAREIESMLDERLVRATFSSIHGDGAASLHADDLQLSKFLGESTIKAAQGAAPVSAKEHTVLVTGANGFLGRYVCLQWMERLAPVDGKVICIVRGSDDAGARERLDEAFIDGDPELEAHYLALADRHLEVLAGDVGESCLGIGQNAFARLAQEVDRICHVAALVNHRLAYEHLLGPNVAGTAEVIRLAASHHKKPIDFVSTEAVLRMIDTSTSDSNESALPLADVPLIDERYAGGYSLSKWAGEHLVMKANRELGIPVNILRGNMMLAHQRYSQQINYSDTFVRLLYSILLTGIAPPSFYAVSGEHPLPPENYDGLPVDVVAAAVVAAANFPHQECRAFNIHNYHHDDGCTLDAFVDWIESAGYPITRLDSYDEWFRRFERALQSLPEEQKQRSALEVLGAYQNPRPPVGDIRPDSNHFKELVKTFSTGPEIPHIDETFIHKCLSDITSRYAV